MATRISNLFSGKKVKTTSNNLLPIYLRVTISGKRFGRSINRYIALGK
ncbi:hypothetical protein ACFS7Z_16725 [Pontibacter toksunensis]|uniref:Arm DNA-binding domain-containing protein n=1 Tax=Pontibacter toksunensis TaxID=1332631 RepID=A0ABW6BYG1_9BACT